MDSLVPVLHAQRLELAVLDHGQDRGHKLSDVLVDGLGTRGRHTRLPPAQGGVGRLDDPERKFGDKHRELADRVHGDVQHPLGEIGRIAPPSRRVVAASPLRMLQRDDSNLARRGVRLPTKRAIHRSPL